MQIHFETPTCEVCGLNDYIFDWDDGPHKEDDTHIVIRILCTNCEKRTRYTLELKRTEQPRPVDAANAADNGDKK